MENLKYKIDAKLVERFFALLILIICAFIYTSTSNYHQIGLSVGGNAGFYPRILAAILGLLAIGLIVGTFKYQESKVEFPLGKKAAVLLSMIIFIFGLPYLVTIIGFWISVFLYIFLSIMGISGKLTFRLFLETITISAVSVGIMVVIFQYGSHVPFPQGMLFP